MDPIIHGSSDARPTATEMESRRLTEHEKKIAELRAENARLQSKLIKIEKILKQNCYRGVPTPHHISECLKELET